MPKLTARWRRIVRAGRKAPAPRVRAAGNPERLQKVVAYSAIGLAFATALPALAAGYQTWASNQVTQQQLRISQEQQALAERGLVTGRFTAATEQLGSDRLAERLGGVHALDKIARDDPDYLGAVVGVLSAFVRDTAASGRPVTADGTTRALATDVQAAFTVLAERAEQADGPVLDLSGAQLVGASLNGRAYTSTLALARDLASPSGDESGLHGARLVGSDLRFAELFEVDLGGASLAGADLSNSHLGRVRAAGASLVQAKVTASVLLHVDLTGADLTGARFDGSIMGYGALRNVSLGDVSLRGVRFYNTDFSGAVVAGADLTGATFQNVRWDDFTVWPQAMAETVRRQSEPHPDGGYVWKHLVVGELLVP